MSATTQNWIARLVAVGMFGVCVLTLDLASAPTRGGDVSPAQATSVELPRVSPVHIEYKYLGYLYNPIYQIRATCNVFIPANSRVKFEQSWTGALYPTYHSGTYGPYPKAQTRSWARNFERDRKWTGKTFRVTMMASNEVGMASETSSIVLRPR